MFFFLFFLFFKLNVVGEWGVVVYNMWLSRGKKCVKNYKHERESNRVVGGVGLSVDVNVCGP